MGDLKKKQFKIKNIKFKILMFFLITFIYSLVITGSTYAYLSMDASNNVATGTGKCSTVSYAANAISNNDLYAAYDYRDSVSTTITLSQSADCEIYTYAHIYIHTDTSTTSPIIETQALKYKVVNEDGLEFNGVVNKTGDLLLTTVPLTSTPTDYKVYLWIDPIISKGEFEDTTYSGYIYATSIQSSTVGDETTEETPPTLFLSKITYKEGFDGWTFNNAAVGSDGVLTLAATGTTALATSDYYYVAGDYWYYTFDGYTTTETSHHSPSGGVLTGVSYFDEEYQATASGSGHYNNGFAPSVPVNQWRNDLSWKLVEWSNYQTSNIKNVIVRFQIDSGDNSIYSQPVVKIRNFKFWGQLYNSFYLINIETNDNIGVTAKKYALGDYDASYFKSGGGTNITTDQITVTQNGIYTFYVADAAGNTTINKVEITRIV